VKDEGEGGRPEVKDEEDAFGEQGEERDDGDGDVVGGYAV